VAVPIVFRSRLIVLQLLRRPWHCVRAECVLSALECELNAVRVTIALRHPASVEYAIVYSRGARLGSHELAAVAVRPV